MNRKQEYLEALAYGFILAMITYYAFEELKKLIVMMGER